MGRWPALPGCIRLLQLWGRRQGRLGLRGFSLILDSAFLCVCAMIALIPAFYICGGQLVGAFASWTRKWAGSGSKGWITTGVIKSVFVCAAVAVLICHDLYPFGRVACKIRFPLLSVFIRLLHSDVYPYFLLQLFWFCSISSRTPVRLYAFYVGYYCLYTVFLFIGVLGCLFFFFFVFR